MASFKRRRAINIDGGYIELMKKAAEKLEVKSGTAVASMIFVGDAATLPKLQATSKARGVSMTEAMWITIKNRGTRVSKATSVTAQDLLTGDEKPLTPQEVSVGEARAREREQRREAGEPEEETPPRRNPRPPAPLETAVIHDQVEMAAGDVEPEPEPKSEPKPESKPNIEPENTPAPKQETESEPSNIEDDTRSDEAEARKKHKMTLSKGQPASSEKPDDRSIKEIKPGEKFYGGVFSI